ncbi:uncharacterized protein M421DRAFT_50728 [Didymella exigua CBS 183.55]|uniref:Uncharacterized protein n=1 Tax=Didymella exigua CBS 183.55 TaxID=1150837 RepID=A0A6A5S3G5_9PLEO|nr:uncharacterized protein M421DRAFT_50728 [Didymella exigua CBS 183.55]KAF1933878.1 hypothetical protein M421DRAFT_50728 [Didymella exigua CBS 183.55]
MVDTPTAASSAAAGKHSVLNSSFPVFLPEFEALSALAATFGLMPTAKSSGATASEQSMQGTTNKLRTLDTQDRGSSGPNEVSYNALKRPIPHEADDTRPPKALFDENKTFTENADVTNISSQNALVDLFYDISENTRPSQLDKALTGAWREDALLTLKIIFNARSIHLGKSNRRAAYGALGWLAAHHPKTFLSSLPWLVRPVISKKPSKSDTASRDADDDFEMITVGDAAAASTEANDAHDVRHGASHGYWKDLLNLVVFAAHDQLKVDGDFDSLLNQHPDTSKAGKRKRWNNDQDTARELRRKKNKEQNERVQHKLDSDPFYRALHVTVTQLFVDQLKTDKALLDSDERADLRKLSLAAKWAPTCGEFHDKHTFILSTIAEALFSDPALHCPNATNRELYLRHVRELYRKQYASPLRKALGVVERDIAAGTFGNIDYSHVPSIAMDRYTDLFIRKDEERFAKYIDDVTDGSSKISGATLLPSTLVRKACEIWSSPAPRKGTIGKAKAGALQREIQHKTIDGQWRSLLKSVRDAGVLQSSVAVCDVSGSMFHPVLSDGSLPVHSSVGLSLLIAAVTTGPFGGHVITFSQTPSAVNFEDPGYRLDDLCNAVKHVQGMDCGTNTDLVAVFEGLLSGAKACKVSQAEMAKQVFVFSDMQFDKGMDQQVWNSSFNRIKSAYAGAGYDMPKLIFWNLAGQSSKPATIDDQNVALVSGYSQGMLKALLETGALDGVDEIVEEAVVGEDSIVEVKKKERIDPLSVVKKAVRNKAYSMLKVVD